MQAASTPDNWQKSPDEYYMRRCLQLAKNGLGMAAPNPAVGCVIVYNQIIIGEGYTSQYGGPHAEVNAIASVKDKSLLTRARLYVTLEPCTHFGKTPPCTDLILKHNIPEVVIGISDPNDLVAGKGTEKLRLAGCKVTIGILEAACSDHHKRFLCFQREKRPYIILKWAQSADGYIAPDASMRNDDPRPYWITNKRSRQLVHKWRSEEQAILVGSSTVIEDNPKLTTRHWYGQSPLRIILDRDLSIQGDYHVLDKQVKTIVITHRSVSDSENGAIVYERIDYNADIAAQIVAILYKHHISSVIIEGGARTLNTFIKSGIWDEARILTGDTQMKKGLKAPQISGNIFREFKLLNDEIKMLLND